VRQHLGRHERVAPLVRIEKSNRAKAEKEDGSYAKPKRQHADGAQGKGIIRGLLAANLPPPGAGKQRIGLFTF
jgi:hypothetical protein